MDKLDTLKPILIFDHHKLCALENIYATPGEHHKDPHRAYMDNCMAIRALISDHRILLARLQERYNENGNLYSANCELQHNLYICKLQIDELSEQITRLKKETDPIEIETQSLFETGETY